MTTTSHHPDVELKNVLANSKSPYLLQHKDNPVAWQEFTPETIALARQLDRPIFLSSGYSACHWCHVFAHESFEDPLIANLLNTNFVSIKIDREERPDVDRMYMTYLQSIQGRGGWPLSVFMTPGLEPFFAGTYFPKGRFTALLGRISELWEDDKEKCEEMAKGVIESLKEIGGSNDNAPTSLAHIISTDPLRKVFLHLKQTNDPRYGGFSPDGPRSRGPKFPSPSLTLEPLARLASSPSSRRLDVGGNGDDVVDREEARKMGLGMLRAIWEGGVRDWVGGGVARYSVDERWRVPHFEKMLYDQAQLISSALDFGLLSSPELFEGEMKGQAKADQELCFDLATDILKYCIRDLLSPEGAFYGAEDADSASFKGGPKLEGALYVWTEEEIDDVLGVDSKVFKTFFGVKGEGNVDIIHDSQGELRGKNILYQAQSLPAVALKFGMSEGDVTGRIDAGCEILKMRRDEREAPGLDDKILAGWNGLMLTALAKAAATLPKDRYPIVDKCLDVASGVAAFVRIKLWDESSQTLTRSYRQGKGPAAQTDDYAFLVQGLIDLYTVTGNESHLLLATTLQSRQDTLFQHPNGGYYASPPDPHVLVRMRDTQDGAEPSSLSVSARNLFRLALVCSDEFEDLESRGEGCYMSISGDLEKIPRAWGLSVAGLEDLERGYREFIITGPRDHPTIETFLQIIHSKYIPYKVILHLDPSNPPTKLARRNSTLRELIGGGTGLDGGRVGLRVCERGSCSLPVFEVEDVRRVVFGQAD